MGSLFRLLFNCRFIALLLLMVELHKDMGTRGLRPVTRLGLSHPGPAVKS